jgi:hypothetical protein
VYSVITKTGPIEEKRGPSCFTWLASHHEWEIRGRWEHHTHAFPNGWVRVTASLHIHRANSPCIRERRMVVVDETKLKVNSHQVYACMCGWLAVDVSGHRRASS